MIRIWRDEKAHAAAVKGDGWLFQLEDIAGGDTGYFQSMDVLADFVNRQLQMETAPPDG